MLSVYKYVHIYICGYYRAWTIIFTTMRNRNSLTGIFAKEVLNRFVDGVQSLLFYSYIGDITCMTVKFNVYHRKCFGQVETNIDMRVLKVLPTTTFLAYTCYMTRL